MSTTHSTSEGGYTVVGGSPVEQKSENSLGLSAVVLNRRSRMTRADSLAKLVSDGLDDVVSVVGPQPQYDVEQLAKRLPSVRFLVHDRELSVGEQINMALREATRQHVLVVWDDVEVSQLTPRIVERLREVAAICVVPTVRSERGEVVPSLIGPAFFGSLLRTVPSQPTSEGTPSLFPYDYVGVYSREKLESIGGFDPSIKKPYWQKLEFGFRSHMWGEQVVCLPSFRVTTRRSPAADDVTPDADYARFHLKCLAIRFAGDSGRLPLRQLLPFVFGSGQGVVRSIREFREIREWVRKNRFRFKQDARRVTEMWEVNE